MEGKSKIFLAKQVEEVLTKFIWLINIRWFALIFTTVGIVFFYFLLSPANVFLLVKIILLEFFLNAVYWLFSRFQFKNKYLFTGFSLVSIIADSFLIAYFLFASHNIGRFSGLIFSFPVIMGGMVFSLKGSFLNTFGISLIYYFFLQLSFSASLIYRGIIFQELETIVYFFVLTYCVGYLSDQTRSRSHRLWELQAEIIDKNNQIYHTQQEIIKTEKIASMTEIAVGLDEEVNGPVTVILGILHFLRSKISKNEVTNPAELRDCLKIIIDQVKSIKETTKNLDHLGGESRPAENHA